MGTIIPSKTNEIYNKLIKERIIFVEGRVTSARMQDVVAMLLYLELKDPKKDITLYIDSPGGSVLAGLALVDTMNFIKPDVATLIKGMGASMGSVIASQGAKGKRFMLRNSEHMIHQVSSSAQGQVSDMEITVEHAKRLNTKLRKMYVEVTGQTDRKLKRDMDRDTWLDAEQAVEYGLADKIIGDK